ncbi:MAG: arsenite methyltransferase [Bacteroidota bacterium]
MDTNSVKQSVVESYSKLAKASKKGFFSNLFACCDVQSHAHKVGEKIGYSQEELAAAPEGSNLAVGCGNPAAFSQIKSGDIVLDLGSGAGFDAFNVSPLVGEEGKVIGLDLSEEMLTLARQHAKKGAYQNVEFIEVDIEQIPLETESVDYIISNCVINLSLQKAQVYKEAYRVLKSEGRIAISDVVLTKELPTFIQESLAAHIACISGADKLEDYLGYIKEAGFQEVRVEKTAKFPIEFMIMDPQVQKIAKELNLNLKSEEARELSSRVQSVLLTARK